MNYIKDEKVAGAQPAPTKKEEPVAKEPEGSVTVNQLDLATIIKGLSEIIQGNKPAAVDNMGTSIEKEMNNRSKLGIAFDMQLSKDKRRVDLSISKRYIPTVGPEIISSINGNTVVVPVDGRAYPVHPSHYAAIKEYLLYTDAQFENSRNTMDLLGNSIEGDVATIVKS